jgi:BirA family biotin operon repressor/biotin-[acetyl-CoA-carboxylase] ligase
MAGDRARARLAGSRFANVRWVDETGSTNADALALAADGGAEGIVVVADHQRAGRGRHGRTWSAPAGSSLLASVLLRPPAAVAGSVTIAVGVALAEAIDHVAGVGVRLKWPNDLVWPGDGSEPDRKVAGVLAEAEWPAGSNIAAGWREPGPSERVVVVVGTGVNVNWEGDPPDGGISLNSLTGQIIETEDLLASYLLRLDGLYSHLTRTLDPGPLVERGRTLSATLGRRVRVDLPTEEVEGTAVDLLPDGRLVVDLGSGSRRVVATGDVVHLRPQPG